MCARTAAASGANASAEVARSSAFSGPRKYRRGRSAAWEIFLGADDGLEGERVRAIAASAADKRRGAEALPIRSLCGSASDRVEPNLPYQRLVAGILADPIETGVGAQ